ncbi:MULTISPECIES: ligase-associated DNA damage response endonuclease PdeM [unclassified Ruegeria]|uniref:ligase-associated DNA damage response endonuclease PdeM n=1 Tax=unclassified Ruegeria TaxID=2625375 RepID=UPI00148784EB|nr:MULTISPECIES: ligase-associated DNA damage response endonuclease PdeM [unclassified Ruegeria]NOE33600.1 ligase-associated DNA damage response endonuclease PdeM [Ruegeria sp. HKCCD7318]
MNVCEFFFASQRLGALSSGALWWPEQQMLCVSDLHLGKSERLARRNGLALPPYDTRETLDRLADDLERTNAETVLCLGDSFDDLEAAQALPSAERLRIAALQAGRKWIWIEGNHDPGPIELGGTHLFEWRIGPLVFRHIAEDQAQGEVSGHYHPKARIRVRGRHISRPAFLLDQKRLILPAYGTFTGGLRSSDQVLADLMDQSAMAILTGPHPQMMPMPR